MIIDEYLIEIPLHGLLFSQELIVTAGLLLNSDCFFDDHEEMRVILQVIVSLFVLPQHEIANTNIVIQLFLAVYPILEDGLKLKKEVLLLLLTRIILLQHLVEIFRQGVKRTIGLLLILRLLEVLYGGLVLL